MTNLRVKQVQPADPNYVHNRTEPEIEPNPNHGGLRVKTVAPTGTALR